MCFLCGIALGLVIFCSLYLLEAKSSINFIKSLTEGQISRLGWLAKNNYRQADEVVQAIQACFDVLFNREINYTDKAVIAKASHVLAVITEVDDESDITRAVYEAHRIINDALNNAKGVD